MRYVTATYRLRPECLDQAKAAILEYVQHVQRAEPGTFTYQCFQSEADPTRFIHLMAFGNEEAELAHAASPFLQNFSKKLFPFCVEGPNYETLRQITSPAG